MEHTWCDACVEGRGRHDACVEGRGKYRRVVLSHQLPSNDKETLELFCKLGLSLSDSQLAPLGKPNHLGLSPTGFVTSPQYQRLLLPLYLAGESSFPEFLSPPGCLAFPLLPCYRPSSSL